MHSIFSECSDHTDNNRLKSISCCSFILIPSLLHFSITRLFPFLPSLSLLLSPPLLLPLFYFCSLSISSTNTLLLYLLLIFLPPTAYHLSPLILPPLVFSLLFSCVVLCCFPHFNAICFFILPYPPTTFSMCQRCTSFRCRKGRLWGRRLDASSPRMQTWGRTQT